jgi:hypothetical protein
MLLTSFEGEDFPHRLTWSIAEEQAKLATEREQGWSGPALVAMVFAFHTVEAYFNFVGERLAPDVWKDERTFFSTEPYRGWGGKLRKVLELVDLPLVPDSRPQKTIFELKQLRDLIAHGKPEKPSGVLHHPEGADPPYPEFTLRSMITPKEKMAVAMQDVDQFANQIHALALPMVNDPFFGDDALRGALSHSLR